MGIAEVVGKLIADLSERPQDVKQAFDSASITLQDVGQIAQNLGGVVTGLVTEPDFVNRKLAERLFSHILAKTYYECIEMVIAHPMRPGMNDQIARRVRAATSNAQQIVGSLAVLIAQGGVDMKMQLDLIQKQIAAELAAQARADRTKDETSARMFQSPVKMSLEGTFIFYENMVSITILKKLIALSLNGIPDINDTTGSLKVNSQARISNLRTLYQASGQSLQLIGQYYRNLRETIRNLPDNTPYQPSIPSSSSFAGFFGGSGIGSVLSHVHP